MFYSVRFENHERGQNVAQKKKQKFFKKLDLLRSTKDIDISKIDVIKESYMYLI